MKRRLSDKELTEKIIKIIQTILDDELSAELVIRTVRQNDAYETEVANVA